MFALVRHADAGSKRRWPGPDTQRPLSAHGQRQTRGLVSTLHGLDIRAIWTSPMTRCRQTVEPLARARALPIRETGLLSPDADLTDLLALLVQPSITDAVLCTHRETLTRVLLHWQQLPRTGGPEDDKTAKGAAWIVENYPGPLAALHYLPADPA
jgi:8-oxo-dGTP diphosphatase